MRNECGALLLLLVSPAFLMALNRANIDLVVFVLIGGGLMCFRCEAWLVRTLGVLLFAVCAVLKYYPLVTLIVLLELRPWRRFATALALYGLVVVLAWPGMASGFKSAAKYMPQPEWLYAYGAPVGLRDWGIDGALGWLIPALLLALWAAVAAWRERARSVERSEESRESRMAWREFLMGAAMLVGVFFLGASYVYKLVFAVWLLPWLWQEHRDAAEARWCRATWWLLLAVVWLEGLAAMGINLLAERASPEFAMQLLKGALTCTQFLTWLWIACLLRFLLLGIDRWLLVWWRDLRASSTARS
ncbi:MAG: hypothetical protein KA257_12205 [Opitutaceae bacterium]|nr:hypothetical protein [Opitutaceae bacterium]